MRGSTPTPAMTAWLSFEKAIAGKQKLFTGMEVDPETEIIVSAGATGAFYCACLALLNPGDEVILFEPYYGYHVSTLVATQAVPVYVAVHAAGWTFRAIGPGKGRDAPDTGRS